MTSSSSRVRSAMTVAEAEHNIEGTVAVLTEKYKGFPAGEQFGDQMRGLLQISPRTKLCPDAGPEKTVLSPFAQGVLRQARHDLIFKIAAIEARSINDPLGLLAETTGMDFEKNKQAADRPSMQ